MWMCIERRNYSGFGNKVGIRKIERNCDAKKDVKRVACMTMDQKAQEAVEKVDLCFDGHELFRIAKQRARKKRDIVGVSSHRDESGLLKVNVDD